MVHGRGWTEYNNDVYSVPGLPSKIAFRKPEHGLHLSAQKYLKKPMFFPSGRRRKPKWRRRVYAEMVRWEYCALGTPKWSKYGLSILSQGIFGGRWFCFPNWPTSWTHWAQMEKPSNAMDSYYLVIAGWQGIMISAIPKKNPIHLAKPNHEPSILGWYLPPIYGKVSIVYDWVYHMISLLFLLLLDSICLYYDHDSNPPMMEQLDTMNCSQSVDRIMKPLKPSQMTFVAKPPLRAEPPGAHLW